MQKTLIILITGFVLLGVGAFSLWRLIERNTPPPTPRTTVTIPEGWMVEEINALLKQEGILVDSELSKELEGYLFPDTYEFFLDSSLEVVENRFKENFQERILELDLSMEDKDLKEIVVMASLIEKEVKDPKEQRIVSGVLWKRIENSVPLQVDATLCYIKAQRGSTCLPIAKSDKDIDSPYNTYLYRGLPPNPIGSPGFSALSAAANPADSPYWYYISNPETGSTIFASTLDEHNLNIVKYLSE